MKAAIAFPASCAGPPAICAPAGDVDTPAQIQDILPTMIDFCGLKTPAKASFDGRSLAPLLTGKGSCWTA
jgi:arylsulfatase A-like enzyme